jgi:hypothetical protein
MNADSSEMLSPPNTMEITLKRLRNRAMLLRFQAYGGLFLIVIIASGLIIFLSSRTYDENQVSNEVKVASREPYSYKTMETKHIALSEKIDNLVDVMGQRLEFDIGDNKNKMQTLSIRVQSEVSDLKDIKQDILGRLANDRENMRLEIRQLKDERNDAIREKHENGRLMKMLGEAAFRVGAIMVSVYFISILANISKYLMRVADHLNAVADSLDILSVAGLSLEKGIASLTPHPIDFQIDDFTPLKAVKDLAAILDKSK